MTNPLDEFLVSKVKTAFKNPLQGRLGNMGPRLGDAVVQAGATGLVGAAAAGLGVAVQHIYDAATKSHDFKNMLENNPDLHEHLQQNPKSFNQAFSTLRTVNPMFTRDPLIAGTYMRQMMDAPLTMGGKAVEALQHRQPPSPILDMFSKGTLEGAKAGLRPPPPQMGQRPQKPFPSNDAGF